MNYYLIAEKVQKTTNEFAEYVVLEKGNAIIVGNGTLRPTFYADEIKRNMERNSFNEWCKEDDIASVISKEYMKIKDEVPFKLPNFKDFNSVKDMIIPCVVNADKMIYKTEVVKHFMDDILIYYRVMISSEASAVVSKELLECWNMDIEELHTVALENLNKQSFNCDDMMELFIDKIKDVPKENLENEKGMMYLVTDKNGNYGANALLDNEILETVRRKIGNYYIVPSSVNELICIPCDKCFFDVKELPIMVKCVNNDNNIMRKEDILSYSVFAYNKENGLTVA